MIYTTSRFRGAAGALLCTLAASSAAADAPDPLHEFLRLDSFIVPIRQDAGTFWAFTPRSALVIEGQQERARNAEGSGYRGELATVASTTKGWVLGTTEGVWEVRLNEGDLRFLPELEGEGVYRFFDDLAFTSKTLYHVERPWERFSYDGFDFEHVNDVESGPDTTLIATDKGLKRLLLGQRTWENDRLGRHARKEHLVRFFMPPSHNQIDEPDSSRVRTRPLLVGERRVYYEDPGSREWVNVEGIEFPELHDDRSDSAYVKIRRLMFQDHAQGASADGLWRRWLVAPTGIARLELPDGGVPYQTASVDLTGDVRDTYVDSIFVWIATSDDLYVIDREFDNVDRFIDEKGAFFWGFLGEPPEFTNDVKGEERGWYALSREGMTEVFSESWSWDAYGFDRFTIDDVLCAAPDIDGFWVGTRRGLRWFDAAKREWVAPRVPAALRDVPVYKMQWIGSDLYSLSDAGIHSSTMRSLAWLKVADL